MVWLNFKLLINYVLIQCFKDKSFTSYSRIFVVLDLQGRSLCYFKKKKNYIRTKFGQLAKTNFLAVYKIIHVYFSHMTYLTSHVTSLNNTCK